MLSLTAPPQAVNTVSAPPTYQLALKVYEELPDGACRDIFLHILRMRHQQGLTLPQISDTICESIGIGLDAEIASEAMHLASPFI